MTAFAVRVLAPLTPRRTPADPALRAEMQGARHRSAIAWLVAGAVSAQLAAMSLLAATATPGGWFWSISVAVVAAAMLAAGLAQLVLHTRVEPGDAAAAAGIGAAVLAALVVAPLGGFLSVLFAPMHLLTPLVVASLGLVLLVLDPSMRAAAAPPVRGVAIGLGVALAAIAFGVIDGVVLMPLTLGAPLSVGEIYSALIAADEQHGVGVIVWWAAIWVVAIVLLAAGLLRNRRAEGGALGALLAATVLAMTATPVTQFAMGMSLGDTIATGGGFSFAFPVLYLFLALLTAAASWLLIGSTRR